MGVKVVTIEEIRVNKEPFFSSADGYTSDELKYNSSWDWLMPVVVKCFDIQEKVSDDLSFKINDALLETNILTLYGVVVEFIEYYKKTNNNKGQI